jgi:hypothetical protein
VEVEVVDELRRYEEDDLDDVLLVVDISYRSVAICEACAAVAT